MKTIRGLSYNSTLGGSDIITRNKMTQNPDGSVSIWVANHAQPCIVDLNVALELAPFRVSRSSPGYFSFKDTPSTSVWVHRFVRGIPPPGWQVDHIDRDRSNNRFTNLRFLTEHENKRIS